MKTRPSILVVFVIGLGLAGTVYAVPELDYNRAYAMCLVNNDWPDAPCFDQGPASHLEFNKAWAPYYEHKGSAWMETKKIELSQALEQGVTEEWVEKLENHNVYQYYLSRNEIQSSLSQDSFFVKLEPTFKTSEPIDSFSSTYPRQSSTDLPVIIIVVFALVIGLITVSIMIWRKRK
ncbi:MAG: hypothetical protein ACW9W3_05780 [Candidatus Nitrosopumilus sp. bin_68KS]